MRLGLVLDVPAQGASPTSLFVRENVGADARLYKAGLPLD